MSEQDVQRQLDAAQSEAEYDALFEQHLSQINPELSQEIYAQPVAYNGASSHDEMGYAQSEAEHDMAMQAYLSKHEPELVTEPLNRGQEQPQENPQDNLEDSPEPAPSDPLALQYSMESSNQKVTAINAVGADDFDEYLHSKLDGRGVIDEGLEETLEDSGFSLDAYEASVSGDIANGMEDAVSHNEGWESFDGDHFIDWVKSSACPSDIRKNFTQSVIFGDSLEVAPEALAAYSAYYNDPKFSEYYHSDE